MGFAGGGLFSGRDRLRGHGLRRKAWRRGATPLQVQRDRSLLHGQMGLPTILAFRRQFLSHVDAVSGRRSRVSSSGGAPCRSWVESFWCRVGLDVLEGNEVFF